MPARTNLFQRLAALVHSRLSKGWIVTESHMLPDSITGNLREVDVVARATVSSYELYLAIECRDHARPADVTWVESMAKKHENLPTSKLVLWSRSGFTKAAKLKATALKIEAVSQAEAASADWATLAREIVGGYVQYLTPTFTPFIDVRLPDGNSRRLDNVPAAEWRDTTGKCVGSIKAFVANLQNDPRTRTVLLDHAPIGSGSFYVELKPSEAWFTDTVDQGQARVMRVGVGISTETERTRMEAASAAIDGRVMTLASADVAAGRLEFLIEESPENQPAVHAHLVVKG